MICNIYITSECDKTAARLLEKISDSGTRVLLVDDDENYLQHMDKYLWSFSTRAFIPHGLDDKHAEYNRVLLSSKIVPSNNAEVVFIINKVLLLQGIDISLFAKCCFLCNNESIMYDALKYLQSKSNVVNCYMEYKNTWIKKDL